MISKIWLGAGAGLAVTAVIAAAVVPRPDPPAPGADALASTRAETTGVAVTVYKSPTCGCCINWVDHLRESGFSVETIDVASGAELASIKADHGIDGRLSSCHTAVVEGYVIEGHVPADVVRQLLTDRPKVAGLAVPGMPIGSPGMEGPNPQRYDILAFGGAEGTTVYATR